MKAFIILAIFFLKLSANGHIPFEQDVRIIKSELNKEEFTEEFEKYIRYKDILIELENQLNQSFEKKEEKYIVLDRFMKLYKRANSKILTSVLLNEIIRTVSLKDLINVRKYIKPLANSLYKNKLCDGYIFKGEYEYSLYNNLEKAISIYKEGLESCKIEWKKFELISRLNKFTYIQDVKFGNKR